MNKRGTHVGMILSFVIFITFVVFIYSVIKPSITFGENKQTTLEYIEMKLTENVSRNITTASIIITSNPSEECVKFNNFLFYSKTWLNNIVKDIGQNEQDAYAYSSGTTNYLIIDRQSSDETFFRIYYSPEFPLLPSSSESGCKNLEYGSGYSIGSINSGKYIFFNQIQQLIEYYTNNYEQLKEDFKIPPGNEFGFDFVLSDNSVLSADQELKAGNVYADEFPVQYVDDNANILSGFINIKVW